MKFFKASAYFFFNDSATTEIYTLSLHDALPISGDRRPGRHHRRPGAHERRAGAPGARARRIGRAAGRSEEHTSELQSQSNLVCRLLLEKKIRETAGTSPRKEHSTRDTGNESSPP